MELDRPTSGGGFCRVHDSDAPVFNLHNDLLLRIFSLNTGEDFEIGGLNSGLRTLKHTSQVCDAWRAFILASPSLWGRVINIDCFYRRKTDDWEREVMRRTGQAPLYVTSSMNENGGQFKLLNSILKEHWERVKHFSVVILFFRSKTPIVVAWDALQKPAPLLKTFRLVFFDQIPDTFLDPNFLLFADHAPSLRTFSAYTVWSPKAPWVSNLRHLEIINVDLHELFSALARMPYLETLECSPASTTHQLGNYPTSLPKVFLPHLIFIVLSAYTDTTATPNMDIKSSLVFLDHLFPSPVCCLELSLRFAEECLISEDDAANILMVVSRYSSNYFSSQTPKTACVRTNRDGLHVSTSTPTELHRFSLEFSNSPFLTMPSLLALFMTCFSNITTLDLNVHEDYPLPLSHPGVANFMSSLSNVEVLKASNFVFQSLLDHAKNLPPLVPSLRTIEVIRHQDLQLLLAFLKHRQDIGLLVHTVSITEYNGVKDFSCMEEVAGLRFLWAFRSGKPEYICGSGNPNKLVWWI